MTYKVSFILKGGSIVTLDKVSPEAAERFKEFNFSADGITLHGRTKTSVLPISSIIVIEIEPEPPQS